MGAYLTYSHGVYQKALRQRDKETQRANTAQARIVELEAEIERLRAANVGADVGADGVARILAHPTNADLAGPKSPHDQ